jgi:hypothetical protein
VFGQNLAHEKNFVATPRDGFANQFLGGSITVHLGCVDQSHPEIEAEAQDLQFFLSAPRMIAQLPRTLAEHRNHFAGRQLGGA